MELLANMLSPSSKPMVVCRSATSIEAYPPGGAYMREWITYAIPGRGQFTVDSDRLKLAPHLERLLLTRKAQALAEGDLEFFRVLPTPATHVMLTQVKVGENVYQGDKVLETP